MAVVASFIEFWLTKELDKRSLAAEVLDNYRELNLFYRFSEKLGSSLDIGVIAQMALDEICPPIHAQEGFVALLDSDGEMLDLIAAYGVDQPECPWLVDSKEVIARVINTGTAEIVFDEPRGYPDNKPGFKEEPSAVTLLCAPLKTEQKISGIVFLVGESDRQFTAGDLKLVNAVTLQTAAAIENAFLHQVQLEQARLERDLATARRVQSGLLPQSMPELEGWNMAVLWQPARMVSGDLYDFLPFSDGTLGIIIADVTDKGVPAALIMANTRSILRAVASITNQNKKQSPGELLTQANKILAQDIPLGMFVTCLLVILDPKTGKIIFSNAGHNLPYHRSPRGVKELRAVGPPLGIFNDSTYDDHEAALQPGESLLMYSDGLPEAHNPQGEMFDYPRLIKLLEYPPDTEPLNGEGLLQSLMQSLADFTGPHWEQEDDVTMVTIERVC